MNQNAVLAKANPTSKACEKFIINAQLELKVDLIPLLVNVLRNYLVAGPEHEDFCVVSCYENWRKENMRLIVRSSAYGGKEILHQKKIEVLEEEDMEFSEDAEMVSADTLQCKVEDNWEDQFGSFFIKKSDNVSEIVKGLNEFYSNTGAIAKKRKTTRKPKEPEIGAKKSKQAIKENKINDDDDVISCELIYESYTDRKKLSYEFFNNNAMIELCYYEMSKLSLEDCVLCYHNMIFLVCYTTLLS